MAECPPRRAGRKGLFGKAPQTLNSLLTALDGALHNEADIEVLPLTVEDTVTHRGVAVDDARNSAVLAFLTPLDHSDPVVVRDRLSHTLRGASAAKIDEAVARIMSLRNPPIPMSQPLEAVADPLYGLGTHPDLVERLWTLDSLLPERCRWVVHGHPALVHPHTGVIFGFAGGTLGYALRLPEAARNEADALGARSAIKMPFEAPWDVWDASKAGPAWRFGRWLGQEAEWCRAAYDWAGEAA